MTIKVPVNVRDAPYSLTLAQESEWQSVIEALEFMLKERDLFGNDIYKSIYIKFEFMDSRPCSLGIYTDPSSKVKDFPDRYNSNIYEVLEDALCPSLAANPMHHALFRYKDKQWQVARVFDNYKESWNDYRASRSQLQRDRHAWFERLAESEFEVIHQTTLYILIDAKTGLNEMLRLLIGVEKKSVWMMTNGLSDRLNPYSGSNWAELPTCDAELLYHCTKAQLGDDINTSKSLAIASLAQVAEAVYWQYIDNLKDKREDEAIDLSKPIRLETLKELTSDAQALEPSTPFLLTSYEKHGKIKLSDDREITPALITIEGALSSKLSPGGSKMIKTATGTLGKAPKTFPGPSDVDLFTALRQEIASHGKIKSDLLLKRMQSYAGLEFYYSRFLPDDLAPHLDYFYLLDLDFENVLQLQKRVREHPEYNSGTHTTKDFKPPSLHLLKQYKGLKTFAHDSSNLNDLNWLESVHWLEELLLSGASIKDFSSLKHAHNLKRLDIGQTSLKSLSPITALSKLETLSLYGIQINDISPLAGLVNLKKLTLSHMPINDISCLGSLQELEEVLLAGVSIKDYSVLAKLPNLKLLSLAQSEVGDLSVLPEIPTLETLYIWDCVHVKDLSPLERYPKLKTVNSQGSGV